MVTNKNKMEIMRDEKTGDLYKNGDKYKRLDVDGANKEQSESTSGGFSFYAKGTDLNSTDVLIHSRSNQHSRNTQESPASEFRYHANENVQFEVTPVSPTRSEKDAKSIKSQMSPDYNECADRNRSKQETSSLNGKSKRYDEVSLSVLKNIKPPKHPTFRSKANSNEKHDDTSREKLKETKKQETSSLPEKHDSKISGKVMNASGKQALTGILKKSSQSKNVVETKSTNKRTEVGIEKSNGLSRNENRSMAIGNDRSTDVSDNGSKSIEMQDNGHGEADGTDEIPRSPGKHSTTRLPPAGKSNSLVVNGDIHHRRPPQPNRNYINHGKSNGTVTQQNNRRNVNDNRHISSLTTQKNNASPTPQSNRSQQNEHHGESEQMSTGSRSSNQLRPQMDLHRNISPKTDSTEYRIKNPRGFGRDNGHMMSPRTEKSSYSQVTSSESRTRSKEFTFRWNAPSRNTSPEATEKSNSPSPKQYKPSARIQSFYAFLSGRAKTKKRKTVPNNVTPKPEENSMSTNKIHHRDDTNEERPKTFVYLRSKASQRSGWDREPGELTYKPSTNGPGEISQAYIGEDSIREAEMNAKLDQIQQQESRNKENRNVPQRRSNKNRPPWYDNGYVLNRRQAGVYKNMSFAYGRESKKQREQRFVQRLAEYEVYKARQQWDELLERERKKKESKERQMLQLNELRQRFEDEAYHRFHTQYVTSRVLEHEKMNRNEFGLPEDDAEEPENKAIIKRKKTVPKTLITEDTIRDIYNKKFNKMFDVNKGHGLGRRPKTPKMEGIDTVVIEEEDAKDIESIGDTPPIEYTEVTNNIVEKQDKNNVPRGNAKEKKFMVKDVINDAKKQMNESKQKPNKTDSSSVKGDKRSSTPSLKDLDLDDDSDDDDMDDIFEKARRKYDLDVDD